MGKNEKVVRLSGVIILTLVLMLSVNIATAGNPPPAGTHPAGPAIIAEMTFTPVLKDNGEYGVAFRGTGRCQGSPVVIRYSEDLVDEHLFDAVNKDSLLDFTVTFQTGLPVLPGEPPVMSDCVPAGATGMTIRAVTDFDEGDDTYKWAKVILLFTVPQ